MIRVGVIGTIGVGKSTFLERLAESLMKNGQNTKMFGEPSIIHGNLNEILRKFYMDTDRWAYSLQSGISAAHEAIYTEIKELEDKDSAYDVALVDAPYSSYIYCNIHAKAGRMSEYEKDAIDNLSRPFHFDYIILLEETADETIKRIMKRQRGTELTDLSYMYEHIADFKTFRPGYLDKYFDGSKFIHLEAMPDIDTNEYAVTIRKITSTILHDEGKIYSGTKNITRKN